MLNNFRSASLALRLRTALLAALIVGTSPVELNAQANAVAVGPVSSDEVHRALDAARIGDIRPTEVLLAGGGLAGPDRDLLVAQRSAALHREQEMTEALQRYFATGDTDPRRFARAHGIAAETAFFGGRYGEAERHAGHLLVAPSGRDTHETEGMGRLRQIAQLLADQPRQRLECFGTGAPAPITHDRVGLIRTNIRVGGTEVDAVIDTGANLSVASASAARRMGLRMVEGDAAVGNSLGAGVGVRLSIADRFEVAGAVLRNVVFLVMEDEALTFPVAGGYRIDAIVGLPVLRALGRVRFGPGDTFRIEGQSEARTMPQNLRLIGSSAYLVMMVAGREHPLFFDSGANEMSLSRRFLAEHPDLRVSSAGEARRGGAGGVELVRQNKIHNVTIVVGENQAVVADVNVDMEPAPEDKHRFGVIGADLVRMFDSVAIDVNRMTVEVRPRR